MRYFDLRITPGNGEYFYVDSTLFLTPIRGAWAVVDQTTENHILLDQQGVPKQFRVRYTVDGGERPTKGSEGVYFTNSITDVLEAAGLWIHHGRMRTNDDTTGRVPATPPEVAAGNADEG